MNAVSAETQSWNYLRAAERIGQCGSQEWQIRDQNHTNRHDDDRQYRAQYLRNRLGKAIRAEQQVQAGGRCQVADFQIGKKDDAQLDGADSEGKSQRKQQRNLNKTVTTAGGDRAISTPI